jgi:hypothetical protein
MIKKTTDYSIFKKKQTNRDLCQKNLKRLRNSISYKNLLELRPIDVNAKMEVIDGQHRLEIARELGLPIFYSVKAELKDDDMILLNSNQKNWLLQDYIKHYSDKGFYNYTKFVDFILENNLKINVALGLFNQCGGKTGERIKTGKYIFPDDIEVYKQQLYKIRNVQKFIQSKIPGNNSYVFSVCFTKALSTILNIKEIDFDIFMNKIEMKLDWIRHCTRYVDYMEMFKNIYNYKNKKPIYRMELIQQE